MELCKASCHLCPKTDLRKLHCYFFSLTSSSSYSTHLCKMTFNKASCHFSSPQQYNISSQTMAVNPDRNLENLWCCGAESSHGSDFLLTCTNSCDTLHETCIEIDPGTTSRLVPFFLWKWHLLCNMGHQVTTYHDRQLSVQENKCSLLAKKE